jgi:putative lipase involved disintegration of autophagic bodies
VALDNVNKLIVVSFRGTDPTRSFASIRTNFVAKRMQNPIPGYCRDCAAAKGYIESFSEVNQTVINTVLGLRVTNGDYQVVVTGHSLGGAVATFAALELRRRGIPVHFVCHLQKRLSIF